MKVLEAFREISHSIIDDTDQIMKSYDNHFQGKILYDSSRDLVYKYVKLFFEFMSKSGIELITINDNHLNTKSLKTVHVYYDIKDKEQKRLLSNSFMKFKRQVKNNRTSDISNIISQSDLFIIVFGNESEGESLEFNKTSFGYDIVLYVPTKRVRL